MSDIQIYEGYIRRYNAITLEWEYLKPKTNGSLVTYNGSSSSASGTVDKEIYDLKTGKVAKVSSTDNAIVRFNGTDGTVQNSGVTIDDSNNVETSGYLIGTQVRIKNYNDTTKYAFIKGTLLTDIREQTIPDKDGTFAMTSDIGNATITIKKNGTAVDSFTANASTDKAINITMSKSDIGLGSVVNTGDSATPTSGGTSKFTNGGAYTLKTDLESAIALKISSSEKGVASGVATLDTNAKVPLSQLPDSILGQLVFGGIFYNDGDIPQVTLSTNAISKITSRLGSGESLPSSGNVSFTNTANSTFSSEVMEALGWTYAEGIYFIFGQVQGSGETSITFGGETYEIGDWLVSTGTSWRKVDNTDAVVSVNGKTGAVVLYGSDIAMSSSDSTKLNTKINAKQDTVSALGSTSKPVYISASGTFSEASTYAGGSLVKLNGVTYSGQTAEFYALPSNKSGSDASVVVWDVEDDNGLTLLSSAIGSATKPVYIGSNGQIASASTYAGGTKVTLNGTAKGGADASFYAPTSLGTNGQVVGVVNGAIGWITPTTFSDTWRGINVNGTSFLGTGTTTGALNFKNGSNVSFNISTAGTIEISATDTTYSAGSGLTLNSNKFYLSIPVGTTAPTTDITTGSLWFDTTSE